MNYGYLHKNCQQSLVKRKVDKLFERKKRHRQKKQIKN